MLCALGHLAASNLVMRTFLDKEGNSMGFGDEVAKVLRIMQMEKKVYKDYLPMEAVDAGSEMVKSVEPLWEGVKKSICSLLEREMPYS